MTFFKDIPLPEWLNIPWHEAEEGKAFSFKKSVLGEKGKKHILIEAHENGIIIESFDNGGDIIFHVISIDRYDEKDGEVLSEIAANENGLTWPEIRKTKKFEKYNDKELVDIMNRLRKKNLIGSEKFIHKAGGRPTTLWFKK